MRLGIIGGTFDPTHIGHLIISQETLLQHKLKKVIFIPAGKSPLKGRQATTAYQRWEMLNIAISSNPYFTASSIEIDREGPSYTVDTLKALKKEYGNSAEMYLIIGMDSFLDIIQWKKPREIANLCFLCVARRPGYKESDIANVEKVLPEIKDRYVFIQAPFIDISSTEIRQRVKEGSTIKYLVPEGVEDYIREKRLYKENL